MSQEYQIIQHEISKFGKLELVLHGYSKDFYKLLEEKGIIDHLKEIDQLGFISKAHPGNNHKRWDYICLQLHFLHKLKHATFKEGLNSSNIKGINNKALEKKMSKLQILQIAVLFSNLGHLKGTLASEISLFETLKENDELKRQILTPIFKYDKEWENYVENVFSNYDFYKVKYIIGLNFISNNLECDLTSKAIKIFFKDALEDDDPDLRRLKLIYLRVRQLSFIYLDSYNSDFPFHIDITKILLNIFNYNVLFNPNSSDFKSFFTESETTLAKNIYISPKSCELLETNKKEFKKALNTCLKKEKFEVSNFLNSYLKQVKFEIKSNSEFQSFQFYISKQDYKFLHTSLELFDIKQTLKNIYKSESELKSIFLKKISNKKDFNLSCIHDQRKNLFYLNIFIKKKAVNELNVKQFIHNYFLLHKKFLSNFQLNSFSDDVPELNVLASRNFNQHYSRKVFLQLLKILFRYDDRLNTFIKFDNQIFIEKLLYNTGIYPTGFTSNKASLIKIFDDILKLDISLIPKDIYNNIGFAKEVINLSNIKNNMNAFYCLFPVELENIKYDPSNLYNCQNPEISNQITDLDLILVLFNNTNYEFYIIEGKDSKKYIPSIQKDYNSKIKPNFKFKDILKGMKPLDSNGFKGGFVKIDNF